jgi:heme-degrading monooxygenase HmoA
MTNSSPCATHAIVHRYQVDAKHDNRATLWEEFVPKLKQIPGFVAVYTFDAPENSEGLSLTLWESQNAAETYLDSSARQNLDDRASAFRPKTDRRVMRVLEQDDNRI